MQERKMRSWQLNIMISILECPDQWQDSISVMSPTGFYSAVWSSEYVASVAAILVDLLLPPKDQKTGKDTKRCGPYFSAPLLQNRSTSVPSQCKALCCIHLNILLTGVLTVIWFGLGLCSEENKMDDTEFEIVAIKAVSQSWLCCCYCSNQNLRPVRRHLNSSKGIVSLWPTKISNVQNRSNSVDGPKERCRDVPGGVSGWVFGWESECLKQ